MVRDRFPIILDRVRWLLERHEVRYASVISELIEVYADTPRVLKENIRIRFSGMGGLSDICICQDNGHKVEHEREANFELRSLLSVLWEEVEDPVLDRIPEINMHLVKRFPTTHDEADAAFASNDLETICDVLTWTTYYDNDWCWVQDWCLYFTHHENAGVRSVAVSCLADLARLHRTIEGGKASCCQIVGKKN